MTPEIAERRRLWADALRSGEWQQITGKLRGDVERGEPENGRCCLGVACEVFKAATGRGQWYDGGFDVDTETRASVMPRPVAEWFGYGNSPSDSLASVRNPVYGTMTLSGYNDSLTPFSQIAALIQAA